MKVEKLLEYQKLDSQLFKIERGLKENKNRILASQMHENIKNAQNRSVKLEERAGALLAEIDKVKKQFKIQEDKMQEFMQKDIESMTKAELDNLIMLKNKLAQNLQILEKNLTTLAENMNSTLAEFNKTIKTFNSAKQQYADSKNAYDADVKAVEGEKNKLTQELASLAKDIDGNLLESYQKRRRENVFPVVVPLKGNSCGGCHMEMPYVSLMKLEEDGMLVCEHCRRMIYKPKG
ncbi:MAG: hypothetical protein J6C53_01345 [Clostridia bacterium]|nr:hypothetical protein [Clostridia bacterium]